MNIIKFVAKVSVNQLLNAKKNIIKSIQLLKDNCFSETFTSGFVHYFLLPPPGGYVIILVCMYVCVYVCMCVCL